MIIIYFHISFPSYYDMATLPKVFVHVLRFCCTVRYFVHNFELSWKTISVGRIGLLNRIWYAPIYHNTNTFYPSTFCQRDSLPCINKTETWSATSIVLTIHSQKHAIWGFPGHTSCTACQPSGVTGIGAQNYQIFRATPVPWRDVERWRQMLCIPWDWRHWLPSTLTGND